MEERKILHIFVIGFHHKKGSQLEYSYPKIDKLPDDWKNITTLALPDGAHNFDKDTVYFHVPSLDEPAKTLFGVSCFQQIPLDKVKNKTADMTRGAVQKAICVLSTVPLYGHIQVKMELVTAAFFEEGDFSRVSLLEDAYHHLNESLQGNVTQHINDGLSARELVIHFKHKVVLLFKLMLLERKVVFFHSPVHPLCTLLLTLVSLHPGLVEFGLYQSATVSKNSSSDSDKETDSAVDAIEDVNGICSETRDDVNVDTNSAVILNERKLPVDRTENGQICTEAVDEAVDVLLIENYFSEENKMMQSRKLERNDSSETLRSDIPSLSIDLSLIANWNLTDSGLPLSVFSNGNLCLPYLSISYLDFLSGNGVRGFTAGAANVLFKQKRQLADILVDIENYRMETQCIELKRQLTLTTEDLRFAEQLVRCASEPRDVYIPDIGREGGDEWIRTQFTLYLLSLLRTSLLQDGSREIEHFNSSFVAAWKNTNNYKQWLNCEHSAIWDMNPGHPCATGGLSVNDVRLRISHVMSSSESGRRLNQAVSTTGKAVGGAITQAKGALSSWWSNLTTTAGDNKPITDKKQVDHI